MSEIAGSLRVLVVDDNRSAAEAASLLIGREGHDVEVFHDGESAITRLQQVPFDLVLTDLRMEPVDGLQVVRAARACSPPVDAIVVTAFGSVEAAVDAMRMGAIDFLTKPVTADQLIRRIRDYRDAPPPGLALVGDSAFMVGLREQAVRLSKVRSTVLVVGETGVGRRHLARWLHQNGLDQDRPLVVAHPGRPLDPARLADAGTVLVPSVDAWKRDDHLALLRQLELLEAGEPPRIIATASPGVEALASPDGLPPELFFRLAVLVVRLPPLRERSADIRPLTAHFAALHGRRIGQPPAAPSEGQLQGLEAHGWPGNLRELANVAERAAVLGEGAFDITPAPMPGASSTGASLTAGFNLSSHLEAVERSLLLRAIEETGGDRSAMSRLLGLERNTLRYKLNKYDLLGLC